MTKGKEAGQMKRRMLVFDPAYTHDIIVERNLAAMVTSRDLGGYFDHIWAVHPIASLLKPEGSPERVGRPVIHEIAPRHTMIEGRIGRYAGLAWFPLLNFLLAQLDLLSMVMRLVDAERIGIVRAEDPHYQGFFGLLVARLTRLPLMIGMWGNYGAIRAVTGVPLSPRLFRKVWIEEHFERFMLRRADRVMVQNEDNRRFVVKSGVAEEKTVIFRLGNALADDHFSDPATRGDGAADLAEFAIAGEPTLMVISRLQKLKLVDHVILAVKELKDRGRRVVALFVGDGPFQAEMEELAKCLGVRDQIFFCGNREQPWLARTIPAVTMVVSPLTGRAMGEAALGAAPMVAYDIDWQSELVETGKTGELVPYLDYQAMADAIARLLDDPAYARRMGDNLRARALSLLDRAEAIRVQIATYETVLAGAV